MSKKKETSPPGENIPSQIVSSETFFTLRKKPGGYYAKVELNYHVMDDGHEIVDIQEGPEDVLEISHEKASVAMLHQAIGGKVT